MRACHAELERASDHEENGSERRHAREAASAPLGGLEQPVEGLQMAVALSRLRPRKDACQVAAYEAADALYRLALGAYDAGAQVLDHVVHDVDLLALEDLAHLFLVDPGAVHP